MGKGPLTVHPETAFHMAMACKRIAANIRGNIKFFNDYIPADHMEVQEAAAAEFDKMMVELKEYIREYKESTQIPSWQKQNWITAIEEV